MALSINPASAVDVFLLLLIGIGPKIALVPYLDATAKLNQPVKLKVAAKMITTASTVAIILLVFGEILTKLLHFSQAALSIAGGILLLIVAVSMVLGQPDFTRSEGSRVERDPLKLAVFPLAVPYLLNPAGIVALVVLSAESATLGQLLQIVAILALILIIDILVFRWANRVSEQLDESRMLITEKVFGFLLAALAVQLAIDGIVSVIAAGH